ncbi:hypothetical protein BDV38DRAFT_248532 [Aspergillus pseudotamarii]|uniref:Uncharacterized protein n=1 Tax=Aspergillus pseudotamarii TaxID=132259 RepID=A0A5N6SQA8_ASPPS|nr:uncharacterized protein BDV38DRAFT_248532 [Aspergillus pseudotamarii]KAE8136878.1 hypothetical protein BDV38DRAFT_248532 [Aspergillus pseudotamarii]
MGYTQRIRGPQGPDVQACIFPGATGGKTANRSGNPGISMTTTRYTGGNGQLMITKTLARPGTCGH